MQTMQESSQISLAALFKLLVLSWLALQMNENDCFPSSQVYAAPILFERNAYDVPVFTRVHDFMWSGMLSHFLLILLHASMLLSPCMCLQPHLHAMVHPCV